MEGKRLSSFLQLCNAIGIYLHLIAKTKDSYSHYSHPCNEVQHHGMTGLYTEVDRHARSGPLYSELSISKTAWNSLFNEVTNTAFKIGQI